MRCSEAIARAGRALRPGGVALALGALDLDADADGKLTWGEIKAAWPRIESYAIARLSIEGCPLAAGDRGLERRSDGAYAVLHLSSPCTLPSPPAIRYALFAEVDPTH